MATALNASTTGIARGRIVTGDVRNNYGELAPGLPNYGLAPGAIFYIKGTNLSTVSTDLLSSAAPGLRVRIRLV